MPSPELPQSLRDLDAAAQTDYITVVQHIFQAESPSHPGLFSPSEWLYTVMPGIDIAGAQKSTSPEHGTTYSFLAPGVARLVLYYPLDADKKEERIIHNDAGVDRTLPNKRRERRRLKKNGVRILPITSPMPGEHRPAEAI
ncbi:MAG TPA: hypothetical protein VF401_02965 [Candidatus Saccharimonadales bacterium]